MEKRPFAKGVPQHSEVNQLKIKRTGILTKFIIVALVIYAIAQLAVLRSRIEDAEEKRGDLEKEIADRTAEIEETQYALDHRDDKDVIEDIARGEGYIYQDEDVYYAG